MQPTAPAINHILQTIMSNSTVAFVPNHQLSLSTYQLLCSFSSASALLLPAFMTAMYTAAMGIAGPHPTAIATDISELLVDLSDITIEVPADIQRRVVPNGVHLDGIGVDMIVNWIETDHYDYINEFSRVVVDSCMTPYRPRGNREQRDYCSVQPATLANVKICHCPGGSFTRGWHMEACDWKPTRLREHDLVITAGNDLWHGSSAPAVSARVRDALLAGARFVYVEGFRRGVVRECPNAGL